MRAALVLLVVAALFIGAGDCGGEDTDYEPKRSDQATVKELYESCLEVGNRSSAECLDEATRWGR
jgi:hypothetical protein